MKIYDVFKCVYRICIDTYRLVYVYIYMYKHTYTYIIIYIYYIHTYHVLYISLEWPENDPNWTYTWHM